MDATLTVRRLASALDQTYSSLIDLQDAANFPDDEQRKMFLSRALAAFCLVALTDCDPKDAAASITDGFNDQGIDAIHFDSGEKVVYLVQAKWSQTARTTIDQGECEKFLRGIRQLILPDFSAFNDRIRRREGEVRNNLLVRADVKVVLVFAYTSPDELGVHVNNSLVTFLAEQNNVGDTEVFGSEIFNLKRIYGRLSGQSDGKISLQLVLREWGTVKDPYRAFYGQMLVSDIASWAIHGRPLFAKNLRYFRGPTEINLAIDGTLAESPTHFWYFNNGITILCKSLDKTVEGGSATDYGVFHCQGASVVNGAQTVGVIWEAAKRLGAEQFAKLTARAHVRVISLEGCPEGFGTELTRAANTQNPIRHRDFAALDPEQHRLAGEMVLDQRRYAFKSGEPDPKGDEGCNIDEATVALACANEDIGMAVQAKREVGQLWQDIQKPPYTTLFNPHLSAHTLWRAVLVMRTVEEVLREIDKGKTPRGEYVAIHGNRFILHRVFMEEEIRSRYRNPNSPNKELLDKAKLFAESIFYELAVTVNRLHPNAYLANLFKNVQKNRELEGELADKDRPKVGENLELFRY